MELFTPALLMVHWLVALVVMGAAIAAVFLRAARRVVQYLIGIQLLIGLVTAVTTKLVPSPAHWILALLAAGGFGVAAAFERKGRPKRVVVALSTASALLVAVVIYLGMQAAPR